MQPVPVFQAFECPTCKRRGVAQVGATVLCETCVNEFLESKVGRMIPVPEEVKKPTVEGHGTG